NPFQLQNKSVIVTGGGSGIGAAISELFAAVGARVFVGDIDVEASKRRHGESGRNRAISVHYCDISDADSVATFIATATREQAPDVLVNNAGIGFVGTIEDTSEADFDRLYNTNVKGTYYMSKALMPHFKARGAGVIVNMASICGLVGVPDRFAYCMTKFAIVGMTKSMAMDHARDKIRVNCICPGRIVTPFMTARINEYPDPEAIRADMDASQPMGHMGDPKDVAAVALYLACDASAFVTGACESVDGGWYAG
ncbi:MAG: glucose 1-dehydrogenase, partial [Pseudomonadales bacterium]|nr:glucose 1-dehydrogenase [Pseudomonadales bacterium]